MINLNKKNIVLLIVCLIILGLTAAVYFIFLKPSFNLSVLMPQLPADQEDDFNNFKILDSPAFKKLKAPDKFFPATTTGRENPFMELQ